jgi:hypothetical protein
MSDVLRPVPQPDPDSPYLAIESLVGRSEFAPQFVNCDGVEDFISPHTINELFVAGVARFQMQLIDRTRFRFLVCLERSLDSPGRTTAIAGVRDRLKEILAQKRMDNVSFEVLPVEDLSIDPRTRKFRLIFPAAA